MEELAFHVFATLADVEGGHRTMVAHHPGPDFARLAFVVVKRDHYAPLPVYASPVLPCPVLPARGLLSG